MLEFSSTMLPIPWP